MMVVQAGRPLVMNDEVAKAAAVVYCFHGGTMTGPGLTALLAGDANFSGKLPVSFPKASAQVPLITHTKTPDVPPKG